MRYIYVSLVVLIAIACNRHTYDAGQILDDAEELVQRYPDSALNTLDSILYPNQLNKSELNRYRLLHIQARDKSYKDISGDTAIFDVRKYYIGEKDESNAALATLYCGQVRYQQKKYDAAILYYLEADKYAEAVSNYDLKGKIYGCMGELYQKQFMKDEAKASFIKATSYFHEAGNHKNEVLTYIKIGNYYSINKEYESAIDEYSRALKLADEYKLKQEQWAVRQNIGIAYREMEDYPKAKQCMNDALNYSTTQLEKARVYINLSKVFRLNKQLDSAYQYIQKSLVLQNQTKEDLFLLSNTYKTLSGLEEESHHYDKALTYHKEYSSLLWTIMKENEEKAVLEVEKKYNLEVVQNENNRLMVKYLQSTLFLLGVLLVLAVVATFYYKKSRDNSKKFAAAERKMYNAMFEMQNMAKNFDQKEKSLRNIVLHSFNVLRKTTALQETMREEGGKLSPKALMKEFNKVVYDQDTINWDTLYHSMNEYHNRLFDRLKARFPELSDDEFKICCLIYAKFNSQQIAIIMQQSVNTIHTKTTIIRQKLGIKKFGNISEFFDRMDAI